MLFQLFGAFRAANMALCAIAAALLTATPATATRTFTTLYAFTGASDGATPEAPLLLDDSGNLYGTTLAGGDVTRCQQKGCGTVFKLAPGGTETVLHAFEGPKEYDGETPISSLIMDRKGNLFGTTVNGGFYRGTVFKLAPDGNTTLVYAFAGHSDGNHPYAGLLKDKSGNLYGTTTEGGADLNACGLNNGCGSVFKIARDGTESLLYSFGGGADGSFPYLGTLIADDAGNLYGTTAKGGDTNCGDSGCGVVFKLAPSGVETVLHTFEGVGDGNNPVGGVILDAQGNLYGTAASGGFNAACNCGVVFKIANDGTYSILHSFSGPDGANPDAGLLLSKSGNLLGTTASGGSNGQYGCGTVFKLTPTGTFRTLHAFTGGNEGCVPIAPLIGDGHGALYGTTYRGGGSANCSNGCGTVFRLQ